MFPDEATLIARGKYSTLTNERRAQLERVQGICTSIMTAAQGALRDCELKPPANPAHIETIVKCMQNLKDARERIITISLGLIELEPEAWPK